MVRTVPHGTVRKVRLVRIFITRANVPYPYLSNNYVPYKRTVLFAEKWSVPYLRTVPYRTVLPSLSSANSVVSSLANSVVSVYALTFFEQLFGGTEFQNRFKKRRKHLLNLGSLEKDCLRTKHFRLALFRVQRES